jgi:hypothetical protein
MWFIAIFIIVMVMVMDMVFNATFNNILDISWRSVLLVEQTGVHRENHRPAASHWQTLSHNVVLSTPRHERDSNSICKILLIFIVNTNRTFAKSNHKIVKTDKIDTSNTHIYDRSLFCLKTNTKEIH